MNRNSTSVFLKGSAIAVFLSVAVGAVAGVDQDKLELHPIPLPVEMSQDMDRPVPFDRSATVTVTCPDGRARSWLTRRFSVWYGEEAPAVVSGETGLSVPGGDEAYALSADVTNGIRIAANTLAGVRWAAYTMRPLVIAARGSMITRGRLLPTLQVSDRPRLGFRAVHLCWFPETKPEQIERAIRLAAQMKFNHAIIDSWGVYRSERHPWYGWPEGKMTPVEIRRLVDIGRDLGITLVPQLNIFGHGSLSRACSVKHAVLDLQPQYEPLFEPGGWNWCLTNPETKRVLKELAEEMHECFGNPPYFHLGCDEAQPPGCPECRKGPYVDLVSGHIRDFAAFVGGRGAKAMIWHDMLVRAGDERWKGFTAYGTENAPVLLERMPKDIVICDWQYHKNKRPDGSWPTMELFLGKGFPVAGCPWRNLETMKPMGDFLAERGGFGYILTTWHHLRDWDWIEPYMTAACSAWGTPVHKAEAPFNTCFALALRMIGHDMKISDPADTGVVNHQMAPSWWPKN